MTEDIRFRLILEDMFSGPMSAAKQQANALESAMGGIKTAVLGAIGAYAGFEGIKSIVNTTAKFEALNNVINYTSLNAKDAADNHEFLKDIIDNYKLPMVETIEGFSQLSASMLGTKLQGQGTRDVFEGLSIAGTAMHLSAQQSSSIFLALSQMMSKGKVQAQELTLQLGQALPGAQRLAAESMGMTTAQFVKEMEKGNISANDFLPKFAAKLKETFGGAIPNAIQSLQAKMTDMDNSFIEAKLAIGEALYPAIVLVLHAFKEFGHAIKDVTEWMKDHKDIIKDLVVVLGTLTAAYAAYTLISKGIVFWETLKYLWMMRSSVATALLAEAQWLLNFAMAANPIGLIVIGLAAVVSAVYLAWNHFEKFRGFLYGLWASIKDIFTGIYDIIVGTLTFDPAQMMRGVDSFRKIGKDYAEGFNEGVKDFRIDNPVLSKLAKPKDETLDKAKKGYQGASNGLASVSSTSHAPAKTVTINVQIKEMIGIREVRTTNIKETIASVGQSVLKEMLGSINQFQASDQT